MGPAAKYQISGVLPCHTPGGLGSPTVEPEGGTWTVAAPVSLGMLRRAYRSAVRYCYPATQPVCSPLCTADRLGEELPW